MRYFHPFEEHLSRARSKPVLRSSRPSFWVCWGAAFSFCSRLTVCFLRLQDWIFGSLPFDKFQRCCFASFVRQEASGLHCHPSLMIIACWAAKSNVMQQLRACLIRFNLEAITRSFLNHFLESLYAHPAVRLDSYFLPYADQDLFYNWQSSCSISLSQSLQ